MQDSLQRASNQHRSLFYSSQLKVLDISQNIRAHGPKLTDNELKNATLEIFNQLCMLEKIFQEKSIPHVYQLIKSIAQNYNSVIAVLIERQAKLSQRISFKIPVIQKKDEGQEAKGEEGLPSQTNLLRQIKKNKLGGIHLFNENYARYLEDHRILDQIKLQKGKRLHRNRLELLRESIFEELNHKTDVEEFPAKNDQITNYILKSKDKSSIYNYAPYEPELQEILAFFQNSQNEANDFLIRKVGKIRSDEGIFSFADFQREIQLKNSIFKRQILQKFKDFILKHRKKEQELQRYINEKQQFFRKLQQKYFKKQESSTQTDLNLDQFLKNSEQKLKEVELKCQALENIRRQELNNNHKEGLLIHQLAIRQNQIEKLNFKISQLQNTIQYVKRLLRQERTKKSQSFREQNPKSLKNISESNDKEKQQQVPQPRQSNDAMTDEISVNEELAVLNSINQIKKTSYLSNSWRRKQSAQGTPLMSFNQLQKQNKDHEALQRTEKKKVVRYNFQNKEELNKSQAHYMARPKTVLSAQCYAQTEQSCQDLIDIRQTYSRNDMHVSRENNSQKQIKKDQVALSSTSKISSKNVEFNVNKNSSERLVETSNKLKQRNNITSLSKIKTEEESNHTETESKRKSQQRPKRASSRNSSTISSKRQSLEKREDIKANKLQVQNKNSIEHVPKAQIVKQKSDPNMPAEAIVKAVDKKQQKSYKIFEVVEQTDEQRETIRNTERSLKNPSIYSHKKLQSQLIDKLNRQINRRQEEKKFNLQHLFSITILPQQSFFQQQPNLLKNNGSAKIIGDADEKIKRESIDKKPGTILQTTIVSNRGKSKPQLKNNEEAAQFLKAKNREQVQSIYLIDDLIKCAKPQNQIKKEKLKNWKKKIITNIKSEVMSQQEAEQMLLIVSESTKDKDITFKYQNAFSPISSIASNIRNTFPDAQEQLEAQQTKKSNGFLRRIKLRTSCCEEDGNEANNKLQKKIQQTTNVDFQQKIEDLIHHEVFHPNFREKFVTFHKPCREGFICSHINKYFETIMKYYEDRKKKGKQCIVLPIEHIGSPRELEPHCDKEAKDSYKQSQLSISKDHYKKQLSASKGKILMRHRLSQEISLPNIKDSKIIAPKTSKNTY